MHREAAPIILEVAKLLCSERRYPQARKYFEHAVQLDSDNGDAWGHLVQFMIVQAPSESIEPVLDAI